MFSKLLNKLFHGIPSQIVWNPLPHTFYITTNRKPERPIVLYTLCRCRSFHFDQGLFRCLLRAVFPAKGIRDGSILPPAASSPFTLAHTPPTTTPSTKPKRIGLLTHCCIFRCLLHIIAILLSASRLSDCISEARVCQLGWGTDLQRSKLSQFWGNLFLLS